MSNKSDVSKNYINAEIEIKKDDINNNIRLINSFEEYRREYLLIKNKNDYKYENEKEIKDKCKIIIINKQIPFSYNYNFNKEGKYNIQYSFTDNMTKLNHIFYECKCLTNIDLSNFNTQNAINMNYMFDRCKSLTNINFSNFNT